MSGVENFDHPNVLKMYGAGHAPLLRANGQEMDMRYYTVTELCENGELFDFVQASKGECEKASAKFTTKGLMIL